MWNIIIGAVFVVGGLSGQFCLRGTDSGGALAVIGAGLIGWGVFQMFRARRSKAPPLERPGAEPAQEQPQGPEGKKS
jgi:predicted phage tail protein